MEITAQMLRDMMISAANHLENNKQAINDLNVFPVPDGDTGTNMSLTMGAAKAKLAGAEDDSVSTVSAAAANALIRGARGNSGVILSLLFRGVSVGLKGCKTADASAFANAFLSGVEAAYKAVMKPTEGTILTVARLSAQAAMGSAQSGSDVPEMFADMLKVARTTLDRTPDMLPVLKQAGVVDAGGKGYITVLEGMQSVLTGGGVIETAAQDATAAKADFESFNTEEINFAYCTEFIIDKSSISLSADSFKAYLDTIGDSIVIGEDDESFKVHVHTNIPGEALTESQKYGTLELAKIENMQMQHDDLAAGRAARSTDDLEKIEQELEAKETVAAPEKHFGMVAVCAGKGLAGVFRELGADQIIEGGQTMNPSTEDILRAIEKTPAEIVFVLPNNKNIIMAAQAAAELASRTVVVIPSKTVPQGISALLSFDAAMEPAENEAAMTDCLAGVMTMQITYAARDSDFDGFEIHAGDYLGLCDGALVGTTHDISELLTAMADKTAAEGKEFVNIFYGADINEDDAAQALALFQSRVPNAEINLVSGGQPIYYYLISAE